MVATLYYSARYLEEFYTRVSAATRSLTDQYEIILVSDGSPDNSLQVARNMAERDPAVKVVELSRNFGHHIAIMAGLSQCQGRRVFLIDCDLEEQPEWLGLFWSTADSTEADMVLGVQSARGGSLFSRFSGDLFYRLFNALSDIKITANQMTVRLMSREYVNALLQLRDRSLFLAGNLAWVGFHQEVLSLDKKPRADPSTYSLQKRISLFVNAITSFSSYPLRIVFFAGLLISTLAGIGTLSVVINKLLHPEAILLGYASLIVSVWLIGGLNILFIGLVGIYLARVFAEVKDRPAYLIRRIYQQSQRATEKADRSRPIVNH